MSKVKIEINGIPLEVEQGMMVIEAADQVGITIPRFCYHKKLSVAANCRMCLVEVERAPKPLPACATPVSEGMKVFTDSPRAIAAQKAVMEFLLINHPLDCPICDQGGECELQDVAVGYGGDVSRFSEGKRVVKDKDIGPLIATDMTRCIHCTRCVRFGAEIAGVRELGATGRGEHTEIGTYVARTLASELSGNVIDLCPVGALTSRPFRYQARAWELRQHPSVAPHDCVGSNLWVHTRRGEVLRAVPRENETVNEVWLSDRDRFGYEGLNHPERLRRPLQRGADGQWREVDWDTALTAAATGLKQVLEQHGAGRLGALVSPSSTVEELYLAQAVIRGLGGRNIDHRLRQSSFEDQDRAPLFPWLGQAIADLEAVDAALVVGANLRKEQPLIAHRLRKAALRGADIAFLSGVDHEQTFPATTLAAAPDTWTHTLAGIARAALEAGTAPRPEGLPQLVSETAADDIHRELAARLAQAGSATVLLGVQAMAHPDLHLLRCLASVISELTGARLGYLTEGANAAGAWLAGAVPHREPGGKVLSEPGLDAGAMREAGLRGWLLLGVEPGRDCADPAATAAALAGAEFVLALSAYAGEDLLQHAHLILPVTPFTETAGTFVNAEGRWQSFGGVAPPLGEARPGWKVLRVLGNLLGLQGFDYDSAEEVLAAVRAAVGEPQPSNQLAWRCPPGLPAPSAEPVRLGEVPPYAVDAIVRRAAALQRTADARAAACVRIAPALAERLGLTGAERVTARQGEGSATLPRVVDPRVADRVVVVPAGLAETAALGASYGPVTLARG
jgi:NADH-quinone oxidoreductase subunit G